MAYNTPQLASSLDPTKEIVDVVLGKGLNTNLIQHRQHLRPVVSAVIEHMEKDLPHLQPLLEWTVDILVRESIQVVLHLCFNFIPSTRSPTVSNCLRSRKNSPVWKA